MKNLIQALYPFQENLDLDNEQRLEWFLDSVEDGFIDLALLREELENALANDSYDWLSVVKEVDLLVNPSEYNREEIINCIKLNLFDIIYPENKLEDDQINNLRQVTIELLSTKIDNEGWVAAFQVFEELVSLDLYKDLEYYNLWKIGIYEGGMERKPIDNKYQDIGLLRYVQK